MSTLHCSLPSAILCILNGPILTRLLEVKNSACQMSTAVFWWPHLFDPLDQRVLVEGHGLGTLVQVVLIANAEQQNLSRVQPLQTHTAGRRLATKNSWKKWSQNTSVDTQCKPRGDYQYAEYTKSDDEPLFYLGSAPRKLSRGLCDLALISTIENRN